ncbi:hypothetical protein CXB49_10505 [Chromobacterium sp. ATCC 53434]|uniref:hypothetical protein n=1 Tax=Chromobacterium sp. (strain ATCC 53434 / SC 14030) TaxID=2059672 RepID=UPI000C763E89|nr:hypothetical protein [Chromobacterium sp. ATCC 53434]AUH51209.1 hypothetical protein CXB49_10505 [Chromobacterium sp. ATCC 53434]
MRRVGDNRNPVRDKFGQGKHGFGPGNPQTGQPATTPGYELFDSWQEEMASVVEGAGFALKPEQSNQLLQAIQQIAWGGVVSRPTTLAGYGITDAAWRDPERRVWGAAFRANKGDPADLGGDGAPVGFAFDVDGDTGLFATKGSEPGRGTVKLMLKIDNVEQLAITNDGALYARQYGLLHEKFAAKADLQNVVAGAPAAMNNLQKLAAALGNDPAFSATMSRQLASKVDVTMFDGGRPYQKRPGGLVEQWFSVPFSRRDELISVVFPTAMAEVYGVWPSVLDAEGEVMALLAAPPTSTGCTLRTRGVYGGPPDAGTIYIYAFGKL